jgi:hypothetical protein
MEWVVHRDRRTGRQVEYNPLGWYYVDGRHDELDYDPIRETIDGVPVELILRLLRALRARTWRLPLRDAPAWLLHEERSSARSQPNR